MPLYIEDDATACLVAELAKVKGLSKSAAVKLAVKRELDRMAETQPLRDQMAAWRQAHPMPSSTGKSADKAFFDRLSDDL